MNAVLTAPEATTSPPRIYLCAKDVMLLLGCKENKAYECIRQANKKAKKENGFCFGQGKANKYVFSKMFQIPIEDINGILAFNSGGGLTE